MRSLVCAFIFLLHIQVDAQQIKLPIAAVDRSSLQDLRLTEIGEFGLLRKKRPMVPAHYHTGIDICRAGNDYDNNQIFPIAKGIVISKRDDGPYAQLIIEHSHVNGTFWTVYEHIAEINVHLHEEVSTRIPIARFMNRNELNKYGWQFDHFHLEILKKHPLKITSNQKLKDRHFMSYTLKCFSPYDLSRYYYNPMYFFEDHL